ncbi:MAG TPA: AAA family ATPase, partial [Thermoanaerobaculia bacterium]|nr:AAA family ATPase [Thermoanaerobaculia bacterium]
DTLFNPTVRALRQILVLRDDAVVERKGREILFEVQGVHAPLKRLSEGYKTVVATGVDIMREMLRYWPELESARGVVLIDELETHLHPRWKMRLVQRLRKAMPQVQFIATTHDPLCLRGMHDGEVAVLVRDEDHNVEQLRDVPNVRGLSVEQLLTSDFFGLFTTEDQAFEEELTRYIALAAKRDRTADEDEDLQQKRSVAKERMLVGSTPGSQVVYQAVNEFLLESRAKPVSARAALKRESVNKVLDLWKTLGTDGAGE